MRTEAFVTGGGHPYRGLDQKLTGVEPAKVMSKILA